MLSVAPFYCRTNVCGATERDLHGDAQVVRAPEHVKDVFLHVARFTAFRFGTDLPARIGRTRSCTAGSPQMNRYRCAARPVAGASGRGGRAASGWTRIATR